MATERGRFDMSNDECKPVAVSRRIAAPAGDIFALLADPGRHPTLDGSGMLRPGAANDVISGVGDVFVMKMFFPAMGDYEMLNRVVAFEPDRRLSWEPFSPQTDPASRNGSRWMFELAPDGPEATLVTETYDCSDSPDRVREAVDNGRAWIDGMTATLERLDHACTG
jgi:uncharacterized protein YndB with AHSA1/START domain